MKLGDLVRVHPACASTYVIVGEKHRKANNHMGRLWLLYNEEIGVQTMYEIWIEVINKIP